MKQPDFLQPETRRNEVLAFLKQDLADLSITRTTIRWGIPVPDEPGHVFYVWFDALMAYHTAVVEQGRWLADLHLIGREIVRFHAVLTGRRFSDWPLAGSSPKRSSPTAGCSLTTTKCRSPAATSSARNPVSARRWAPTPCAADLLREIVFGADGNFAFDAMVTRYNADLANGLGNLASRTLSMIQQYRGSIIPTPPAAAALPLANNIAAATAAAIDGPTRKSEFSGKGLEAIWQLIGAADRYVVEQAPWKLFKAKEEDKLDEVLYSIADALRVATLLGRPGAAEERGRNVRACSAMPRRSPPNASACSKLGQLPPGETIPPAERLAFPRLEMQPTIDKMNELEEIVEARQDLLLGKTPEPAAPADPGRHPPRQPDHHRRLRQSRPPRRPGEVRRKSEGLRQAAPHENRHRRGRTPHHRGRHLAGLRSRSDARPQGGHRRQPRPAQAQGHRIPRHDRRSLHRHGKPTVAGSSKMSPSAPASSNAHRLPLPISMASASPPTAKPSSERPGLPASSCCSPSGAWRRAPPIST
jgi:hypothetical protein